MMQLRTELMKIVGCLNDSCVDYALCGGLAVAVHGYVRATKDIDILICQESLVEALRSLALIGYDLEQDCSSSTKDLTVRCNCFEYRELKVPV